MTPDDGASPVGDAALVHYETGGERSWGVLREGWISPLRYGLSDLLALDQVAARAAIDEACDGLLPVEEVELLVPLDRQDVWAAGVTYERSRDGRIEESGRDQLYDGVYRGERPELFFKATPDRVVAAGQPIGIRFDSTWNVPEPEVGVLFDRRLEIFGFTIGNDVSSRSIEGENPLYLPQAKIYDRACAIGPWITPVWALNADPFTIELVIERDGEAIFREETSTAKLRRSYETLGRWMGRALTFPDGVVLLTGTGIVPERRVSLRAGDAVAIGIAQLGTLRNPVITVGSDGAATRTADVVGSHGDEVPS